MAFIQAGFFSETLQLACSADVLIPERGAAGKPRVLYLLHGLSDDHTMWQRRTSIERYADAYGLCVIMPAVERSFYTDMADGGRFWTYVSEELPAIMSRMFNISGRREDTFVAGLSMGGYGAFKLALRQPERFAAAASLSGVLDLRGHIMHGGENTIKPEMRRIFGHDGCDMDASEDLVRVMEANMREHVQIPRLYACCGRQDFLYQCNLDFIAAAKKLGVDVAFTENEGTHEWGYWDVMIQDALRWMLG